MQPFHNGLTEQPGHVCAVCDSIRIYNILFNYGSCLYPTLFLTRPESPDTVQPVLLPLPQG